MRALERDYAEVKWWTIRLGMITAVAALPQLAAIAFQIRIARRQNSIIKTQTAILSQQATSMALTNDHTRATERAYVGLSSVVLKFQPAERMPTVVEIRLLNHGKTPGTVTRVVVKMSIAEPTGPSDYAEAHTYTGPMPAMMGDALILQRQFDLGLTAALIEDLQAGRRNLWVYGFVEYLDKFGEPHHRTGFIRRSAIEANMHGFYMTDAAPQYEYTD